MNRHWIGRSLIVIGVLTVSYAMAEPRNPKKDRQPAKAADLTWPGPPERPRVRYVGMISSAEDITGKAKLSLIERISGRSPLRDRLRLIKPYGVAVDQGGRIFVADPAQRAVLIFDPQSRAVTRWQGNSQFPLFLPIGLAFDGDGRVFVSDSFGAQVIVFNSGGKPMAGIGKGTFKRPGGMAVDSRRGRLYVADAKLDQVLCINLGTLKVEKAIGGTSTAGNPEPGRFSAPTNLALDSRGRIYVTDTWNCRVQVLDPEGKFLHGFGTLGVQAGKFVRPKGIAIDSEDHVYVIDSEFNNFQIFTSEGKPLLFVGSLGEAPGQFQLPTGMTIDHQDRIYVTEQRLSYGRLQIFQYLKDSSGPPRRRRD